MRLSRGRRIFRFHHDAFEAGMLGYCEGLGLLLWSFQPGEYLRRADKMAVGADRRLNGGTYKTLVATKRALEFDVWGPAGGVGVKPEKKVIGPTPMGNNPLMDWGVFPHRDEDKGDYQVASWTIAQLQNAPKDQPFFIAAGFFLPHVPVQVGRVRVREPGLSAGSATVAQTRTVEASIGT